MPDRFDFKLPLFLLIVFHFSILLLNSVLTLSTQTKADKDRCFHFNAPEMMTDTHDNNICAQRLNRNRTFSIAVGFPGR